jgi:hypothetical protein
MRPVTPLAVENGVGKLAANARQMSAWERECGELPSPNLSLLDRKVGQGLFVSKNKVLRTSAHLANVSTIQLVIVSV